MKRKYNKTLIDTRKIADFFGMAHIDVYKHIKKGNRLDLVYSVLSNDDLTIKEKRTYLFHNTSLSLGMKNNLWERFTGDYGFEYCKTGSNSLDVLIQQEGGKLLDVSL